MFCAGYAAEGSSDVPGELDVYGDFATAWNASKISDPAESEPKYLVLNSTGSSISKEDYWLFRHDDSHIWDREMGAPEECEEGWAFIYWYWNDLIAGADHTAYFQVWSESYVYDTLIYRWDRFQNQWVLIGTQHGWEPPRFVCSFVPEDSVEHFLAVFYIGQGGDWLWVYCDQANIRQE
jgi:hypothetical protein